MNSLILSTKVEGQGVKPKGGTGVWHECGHSCITLATEHLPHSFLHLLSSPWNHNSIRASFRSIERKGRNLFLRKISGCPFWSRPVDGEGSGRGGCLFFFASGAVTHSRAPSRERPCGLRRDPSAPTKTYQRWPWLTPSSLSQIHPVLSERLIIPGSSSSSIYSDHSESD